MPLLFSSSLFYKFFLKINIYNDNFRVVTFDSLDESSEARMSNVVIFPELMPFW